jgi:broad specificity phosphatase PhoE
LALARHFSECLRRGELVPTRVVSSPLSRCTATALMSAGRLGIGVETDERLIEIAHGSWEGRYRDELAANDPERYRMWRKDPAHVAFDGGETLDLVLARWRSFASELVFRSEPTLIVTHDAVVRCALVDLKGRTLDDFWKTYVENAAFALIERDGGRLRVVQECVHAHLDGLRADVSEQAL